MDRFFRVSMVVSAKPGIEDDDLYDLLADVKGPGFKAVQVDEVEEDPNFTWIVRRRTRKKRMTTRLAKLV